MVARSYCYRAGDLLKAHVPDGHRADLDSTVAFAEFERCEDQNCDRTRSSPIGDALVEGMNREEALGQDVHTDAVGFAVGMIEEGFSVLIRAVGR